MKNQTLPMLKYACTLVIVLVLACNKEKAPLTSSPATPIDEIKDATVPGGLAGRFISILNPGFEEDKDNWGDPSLFAISTSDKHSGSKSAKLDGTGDRIQQTVAVLANNSYTLTAWIFGRGTIGAKNGSTVLNSQGGTFSAWTKVTVSFNSGSATSIIVYGAYNAGTGRFDDFILEETSSVPPPAAPSGLSATATGTTSINLTWVDNSTDETGFKLERKTGSGGTYAEIAGSIAANTTTFNNTGLTASTTYFYRIRSYNASGNSTYSSEVSATTSSTPPPAAPSGLTAIAAGTSVINLAWSDNSNNETGFKLERKTGSGGTYSEIAGSIAAGAVSFSNTGLTANTTYFYRIRSYNASGNSTYSNEASATTSSSGGGSLPANILNLTNWKITIPVDGPDGGTNADEISQPQLAAYSIDPWFKNNATNTGVLFRAHTGGATTSGSGYPRSELREMTNNGTTNASWSSGSGTHTMEIDQAIMHLPVVKPHIVAGQIHDAGDDVIVFRLEGSKLFIDINGDDGPTLTSSYVLGTRFKVKFVVSNNQTKCYYNDVLKYTLNQSYSGAYFKAGAYTQSSCTGTPGSSESCSAYGEVLIYNVTVSHQ
ncbi:MAG TPA: polysaccharide lyase family 7 protein [Chitinophagaceae bacterium]|jgi:hypothetical protein|nr:polysaccharide lyase family 7 protein [Chitinophagaceae bacterium]